MKKLMFGIALISSQFFFAQGTTKTLSPFTEIKVYDKITVELIPSDVNKIVLSGTGSEEVIINQKNEELKIKMPLTQMLKGDNITAQIYYNGILDEIEAFEGSYIFSNKPITGNDLDITAKEGSKIKLDLNMSEVDIDVVTGATVNVKGQVSAKTEISIKTGGVVDAKDLKSNRAEVTVSAGGQANVFAKDFIKARVNAGGTINIYGKPAKIDQQTFAGGTISEK